MEQGHKRGPREILCALLAENLGVDEFEVKNLTDEEILVLAELPYEDFEFYQNSQKSLLKGIEAEGQTKTQLILRIAKMLEWEEKACNVAKPLHPWALAIGILRQMSVSLDRDPEIQRLAEEEEQVKTIAEIRAELTADGVDLDQFHARIEKLLKRKLT